MAIFNGTIDQIEKNTNKVTSLSAQSTDEQYPSAKIVYDLINTKVTKETGKGLSVNDYTNEDKAKVQSALQSIGDGSITSSKIANGAVTAEKIANGSITSDKIASGVLRTEPTLIKSVTISDGTTSRVEISLDTDGNSFLLKNQISIYIQAAIGTSTLLIFTSFNTNAKYACYAAAVGNTVRATKEEFVWNGKEWSATIVNTAGGSTGTNYNKTGPINYLATDKEVTKVILATPNSTTYFPSGTTIEIYGENYV